MLKKLLKDQVKQTATDDHNARKISAITLRTKHKNQLLTFFKPEVFLDKTPAQIDKIIDLVFKKFADYKVVVDGTAIFPGPALAKYGIMDRHYGVINQLSKNASKILSADDRREFHKLLCLEGKNLKILGGHEAFAIAGIPETAEFDRYWLESSSVKIRGGHYGRNMRIADEEVIVVNGFHPHQLAHYTAPGRKLAVLLISSDTPWKTIREEMLGDVFPEKADPNSIRGHFYNNAGEYGFEAVTIANNILHISAGPTEALFEIDNFFRPSFGVDIVKDQARLASQLLAAGLTEKEIKELLHDKELHAKLEHLETQEAVKFILSLKRPDNRKV